MNGRTDQRGVAVLLFGMPGAGKGTQGKALGAMPGFIHVSSGEVFRNLNQLGRYGRQVASYTSNGHLVPDDLTIRIFLQHLSLMQQAAGYNPDRDVLLLDGIPRTYAQAELLDQQLEVRLIFHLVIPDEEEAIRRILGRAQKEQRADDAQEGIVRKRIDTFRRQTADTLRYYPPSLRVDVDATELPIQVLHRMSGALCQALVESSAAVRKGA